MGAAADALRGDTGRSAILVHMADDVRTATDRRVLLLDAAVRVVSTKGLRGLTHRAVETEAGLPHGSTTYYFGGWQDLVAALLSHLTDQAREQIAPMAQALTLMLVDRSRPVDVGLIVGRLLGWIDQARDLELARFEMQVAGARDADLQVIAAELCGQFRQLCVPVVAAVGSPDVERDSQILVAALDGWLFSRLTLGAPDDEAIIRGVGVLLAGLGRG